jgi:plasmid stabilization system protein ParE
MTYEMLISEEAEIEIRAAKQWYEKQSAGLGEIFSGVLKATLDALLNSRVDHKLVFGNTRRILLRRFPYSVYYTRDEKNGIVEIIALLHNKQSREGLEERI